jgi:hypothetical protein
MEVIVRLQDRALCASITCTTGTYAEPEGRRVIFDHEPEGRVIFDHRHNAAMSAPGTAQGHPGELGIIEVMSKSSSRRFPVTVTHLPVTRCQICDRTVAYRPGKISEVLTEDYRRAHPESLGLPSQ